MKEELLYNLPEWYKTINPTDNFMVLSDDFDSYYSCLELYRHTGIQIGAFYDINSGLYINEARGTVTMHATTMDLWAQPNTIDGTGSADHLRM